MAEEKDIAIPFFHTNSVEDPKETKANGGVPIYVDAVMVEIRIPGSRDIVVRPVEEQDKRRWPKQWEAFERGQKQELDGVPVTEWANATEAERKTVQRLGMQTVEQVAGLSDHHASTMRIQKLKQKAMKFLDSRKGAAEMGKLQVEVEDLKKLVAKLAKENTELKHAADNAVSERDEGDGVHAA